MLNDTITTPWHAKKISEILEVLQSTEQGMTKEDAARRFQEYGPNKLPEGKVDSLAIIFLRQFQSPLIYILFAAAAIIFFIGQPIDASVIFLVLIFNAVVGTIQEGRAQNTLRALNKFVETSATVMRDGKEMIVQDIEVVAGDIIIFQEGEKIPADARIMFANTLKIDEASLTGESEPTIKDASLLTPPHIPVAHEKNMVFKGTHVLTGNGTAIVVATGLATEVGKIAQKIAIINTEIPLKTNIRYLSGFIIMAVAGISAILILLGVASGRPLKEMFTTAVALAVSIIPEGLPIVMTLVLATGVWRMSKHHALVKKLQAVETLGQTQIIAVDKTGTLTKNEMVIQRVYVGGKLFQIEGNGYEPQGEVLLDGNIIDPPNHQELMFGGKIASFCANARLSYLEETNTWKIAGDPTEAAMLVFSKKIGFHHEMLEQETPKIFELPFNYKKKYHATIRMVDGKHFLTVVGAPEKVINLCEKVWKNDRLESLDNTKKEEIESIFSDLARLGFRILAFAINPHTEHKIDPEAMPALAFVGLFAMKDALRPEVKETVRDVKASGIRVVMITGDHRLTAEAVAKEAGIFTQGNIILTGEQIEQLNDDELAQKLTEATVFARVTPDHKLRIIQAYRKRGEIVAMTGDGVNDAPSLMAADIGIAMGRIGTEVAKEASDIILLDDNFGSIVFAAEEGRNIYKTIKKVILYLFSTSTGEALVIIGAILLGLPLPILPVQIIWLNFVTDGFLDVALAMEPKEKGLLKKKFEHPKKWIVDMLMAQRICLMAIPMALGTLWIFQQYAQTDIAKAWAMSLTVLAVFQWFNAWNCRSEEKSIFQINPFSNKFLIAAIATVVILQLAALYTPFLQRMLHTQPLTLAEWLLILPVAASVIVVEEIRKFFYRRTLDKL